MVASARWNHLRSCRELGWIQFACVWSVGNKKWRAMADCHLLLWWFWHGRKKKPTEENADSDWLIQSEKMWWIQLKKKGGGRGVLGEAWRISNSELPEKRRKTMFKLKSMENQNQRTRKKNRNDKKQWKEGMNGRGVSRGFFCRQWRHRRRRSISSPCSLYIRLTNRYRPSIISRPDLL